MKDFMIPEPKSFTECIEYFLLEYLPSISQQQSDDIAHILTWPDEVRASFHFAKRIFEDPKNRPKKSKKSKCLNETNVTNENYKDEIMDKKIKAIQKKTKSLAKDESSLLKLDKKHDKKIAKCDMKMKKK